MRMWLRIGSCMASRLSGLIKMLDERLMDPVGLIFQQLYGSKLDIPHTVPWTNWIQKKLTQMCDEPTGMSIDHDQLWQSQTKRLTIEKTKYIVTLIVLQSYLIVRHRISVPIIFRLSSSLFISLVVSARCIGQNEANSQACSWSSKIISCLVHCIYSILQDIFHVE